MKRFFMLVALIIAFGAKGTRAENQSGTINNPKQLNDSVVVTANRNLTPLREIASSVTVITSDEISLSQKTMVSDLLRSVPGIDVVQSGGIGRSTSVFLRGANSHHTLVIIDGVEMNDPSSPNGYFDFAHLTVDNIERIEILRGAQSVLYGSDAIGGVIQIFSKEGSGKNSIKFNSETGTYSTYNESLQLSGSKNNMQYSLSLSRRDSDGFSATSAAVGSSESDGYRNSSFSANFGYSLSQSYSLGLNLGATNGNADIDKSFGNLDDPNYYNSAKSRILSLNFGKNSKNSSWSMNSRLSIMNSKLESKDDYDRINNLDFSVLNSEGGKVKFETQFLFEISETVKLTVGEETEKEKYNSSYFSRSIWGPYADTVKEVKSSTSGLFALSEFSFNNNWFITMGVRVDYHEKFKEVATFRITSAYLFEKQMLKLKANYGTGFKTPSLFQLFHQLYGNPDLSPEKSKSWEVGLEKYHQNFSIGFTYFDSDLKDLVALDPITFRSVNISKVTSSGTEYFAHFKNNDFTAKLEYTFTRNKNLSDNAPI